MITAAIIYPFLNINIKMAKSGKEDVAKTVGKVALNAGLNYCTVCIFSIFI